jgi:hypothetical protein
VFTGFYRIHAQEIRSAFYSTDTGLVGIASFEIRRYDRIYPSSLRWRYVLYSFLGVSYVHGIMEDAAVTERGQVRDRDSL